MKTGCLYRTHHLLCLKTHKSFCRPTFTHLKTVSQFTTATDDTNKITAAAAPNRLNFSLTNDQKDLISLAERFTRDEIIPVASHYDKTGEFPWPVIKKAHDVGLLNWHIPQKYGGMGIGTLDGCLIVEQLAYGCCGITTIIDSNNLGAMPIMISGNHEQKKKYLSWLIEEPIVCSYGVTEPNAGSDVAGIKTKAVKRGMIHILEVIFFLIINAWIVISAIFLLFNITYAVQITFSRKAMNGSSMVRRCG